MFLASTKMDQKIVDKASELQNALRSTDEALHNLKHSEVGKNMLTTWDKVCSDYRRIERIAQELSDVVYLIACTCPTTNISLGCPAHGDGSDLKK